MSHLLLFISFQSHCEKRRKLIRTMLFNWNLRFFVSYFTMFNKRASWRVASGATETPSLQEALSTHVGRSRNNLLHVPPTDIYTLRILASSYNRKLCLHMFIRGSFTRTYCWALFLYLYSGGIFWRNRLYYAVRSNYCATNRYLAQKLFTRLHVNSTDTIFQLAMPNRDSN